jgi:hypothetical protein
MRLLGPLSTTSIVIFWVVMNCLLVRREVEYQSLSGYRRGVIDFLGERVSRERWMGIYHKKKRIGHTGFAVERRLGAGELGYRIDFSTRFEVDLLGQGGRVTIEGAALLDPEMAPQELSADATVGSLVVNLEGRRSGEGFLLTARDRGKVIFQHSFAPGDLHFGDSLAPLPLGKLEVGQTQRLKVFDPVFRENTEAETRVVAQGSREVEGVQVDCLELETKYRGMVFRSLVTPDGEVLRQDLPPPLEVTLLRERFRPTEASR